MSNKLGNNGGRSYDFLFQPVKIDCNVIVDSANGNGLGTRSLKGSGVRNVFMNTSAAITGTVATTAAQITAISQGTSALQVGMPVQGTGIPAGTVITQILSSSAVAISQTPTGNHSSESITYQGVGAGGFANPNPAAGFAVIQLKENYYKYAGGFSGFVSPLSGSTVAINSTALSIGQPYVIVSVGSGPAGAVTIAPGAGDSSGSLAGSWFQLFDGYGNTYIFWLYVTGVGGSAPVGVGGIPVQVTIAENATVDNITTAISNVALALANAAPAGVKLPSGVAPFTSSGAGTATLTLTSTGGFTIPGPPGNGVIAGTAWTFAQTVYNTNQICWQGVGLQKGVAPNVGAAFVATSTGVSVGGGSTGLVETPSVSGVLPPEVVGDPSQTLNPAAQGSSPNVGGWLLVQFLAPTQATVDGQAGTFISPMIPTAPANGSVVGMSFFVEAKSVVVAGE